MEKEIPQEKELIIVTGTQGSGKTTFVHDNFINKQTIVFDDFYGSKKQLGDVLKAVTRTDNTEKKTVVVVCLKETLNEIFYKGNRRFHLAKIIDLDIVNNFSIEKKSEEAVKAIFQMNLETPVVNGKNRVGQCYEVFYKEKTLCDFSKWVNKEYNNFRNKNNNEIAVIVSMNFIK